MWKLGGAVSGVGAWYVGHCVVDMYRPCVWVGKDGVMRVGANRDIGIKGVRFETWGGSPVPIDRIAMATGAKMVDAWDAPRAVTSSSSAIIARGVDPKTRCGHIFAHVTVYIGPLWYTYEEKIERLDRDDSATAIF